MAKRCSRPSDPVWAGDKERSHQGPQDHHPHTMQRHPADQLRVAASLKLRVHSRVRPSRWSVWHIVRVDPDLKADRG
ncbi:hypothetical protein B0J17DRAFT_687673 [Rhizoctonia solani]|nr:hypothetical protein B0J17DRAFT_687673 [Rhizoctonia solani]